jgi:hypothetical protein
LVGALAIALVALPWPAQATPARTGMIMGGLGGSQRGIGWPGQAIEGECQIAPDCLAWLESGCDPALAGREPAATASIVDVADLADGETTRVIDLAPFGGAGLRWGEVLVQFWRPSGKHMYPWFNCMEIQGSRFLAGYDWRRSDRRVIPAGAKWMTVTSNFDNIGVVWRLT